MEIKFWKKFPENFGIYCKIYTMKKVIRLTASDLMRIVKRVIKEEGESFTVTPGGNYLLSGGRNQSDEERIIFRLKALLMQYTIYKQNIGDTKIPKYFKDELIQWVEGTIESSFELAEEKGIEDLTNIKNVSEEVRNRIYSMYNIKIKKLK